MPERRGPAHVGRWIEVATARHGIVRPMKRAEAVVAWRTVAGPELARFAVARSLRDGVLYVDVPDAETAMHLAMQRTRFVDAFARRLDARTVRDVRFVTGAPDRASAQAGDTPRDARPAPRLDDVPADDPTWSRLTDLAATQVSQAPLRDAIVDAARAFAARLRVAKERGEGTCPTCGAWTPDGGPCHPCTSYRTRPAVLRRVEELLEGRAGATSLSDGEDRVAHVVAIERCDDAALRLLPSAVRDVERATDLATWVRRRQWVARHGTHLEIREVPLDPRIDAVLRAAGITVSSDDAPDR